MLTLFEPPLGFRRILAFWAAFTACWTLVALTGADESDSERSIDFDSALVQKALASLPDTTASKISVSPDVQAAANQGHVKALYQIAKATTDSEAAVQLHQQLASQADHIPSHVQLGMHYYKHGLANQALQSFVHAGENGPHQASLYNAGRIYSELKDWVPALAYIRACAVFDTTATTPSKLTQTCQQALEALSKQVALLDGLTVEETADLFVFGSLEDLDDKSTQYWINAVMALQQFNQTFVATSGQNQDRTQLEIVMSNLHQLWEESSSSLSNLQAHLLLEHMNDALGPLAGADDQYIPLAAVYAEALGRSTYCFEHAAVDESQAACFNGAVASSMSYCRRLDLLEGCKRVWKLATQEHPSSATKWNFMEQTPRVYHPGLKAQPWWDKGSFPIVQAVEGLYKKRYSEILAELQAVKDLQEGKYLMDQHKQIEIDVNGEVQEASSKGSTNEGLARIFTPYIGVRTSSDKTQTEGAGGWSSYGPLSDGKTWNEDKCRLIPTLCQVLQEQQLSLCTFSKLQDGTDVKNNATDALTKEDIARRCGGDYAVTMLRLRPGTHILPHCGTTNRRLIMHWCLEGCDGIVFHVGNDPPVHNYGGGDGSAIVFDDSFEHHVEHKGRQDRFVLLAVLAHPDTLA